MFLSILIGDTASREVYPFFNWKLFFYIPKVKRDYGVLIKKIDNKPIKPIYYEGLDPKFKNNLRTFYLEHFIETGRDLKEGKDIKPRIEAIFSPEHSFSVDFVERRTSGLERIKAKNRFSPSAFLENKTLEAYEVN
jgi:hypothetical protein